VVQTDHGKWEIRVIPMAQFGEKDERRLVDNIHKLVDHDIDVRVVKVAELPRTTTGKFKWVSNECHNAKGRR
jgi:hypothetical protein